MPIVANPSRPERPLLHLRLSHRLYATPTARYAHRMLIIGLTGGIGSGKSTVARHFEALGAPVIDADDIGRQLVEPGQPALAAIVKHFGSDMLDDKGRLNRARLREQVFTHPKQRHELEAILHPRIRAEVQRRIANLSPACGYCLVSVPLLIESGWQDLVQRVLVVDTTREIQIQRATARDGITRQQAEAIITSQANRDARLQAADDVIHNEGDLAALQEQVEALHRRYCQLATEHALG